MVKIAILSVFVLSTFIVSPSRTSALKNEYSVLNSVASRESVKIAFEELQDTIDRSIAIDLNGRYVYDQQEIRSIIYSSDIDFVKFNSAFGKNYTKESLYNEIIASLQTTVVKTPITTNGTYCNRNYSTGGWNYVREFMSSDVTTIATLELRRWANDISLVGLTRLIPNPIATIIAAGGIFTAWYYNSLANAWEYNNNGCGVVSDINKFTTIFTVWDQRNFYN